MPIIRIDDDGQDVARIEKIKCEIARKRNARIVTAISGIGIILSGALFFFHSENLGILTSVWSVAIVAGLNLIDD